MSPVSPYTPRRVLLILVACFVCIDVFATEVRAQMPPATPDEQLLPACGRLRSLVSQGWTRAFPELDEAYRETLADTDVLHYALDIEVSDLDPGIGTCWLAGTNVMTIQSKSAALDEFSFRLRDNYTIDGAYIDGSTPVTVTASSSTTRVVTLDRTYALDEIFTLTIEYSGNTVEILGTGSTIRVGTQPDDTPVVATLSQPYFAYTWWPVKEGDFGEPGDHSDKATLEFAITAPDTFDVPCNGLLQGIDILPDNRRRHRWKSDYPIIPSLVAFAATEYNTWTGSYEHPGGSMPVEFYIYSDWDTPENRSAWELSIDMIGVYASLFGEYPFIDEKYGIYNFPWAGLEHQTMTAQGAEGGYTGFGEYLTAHELAHQWWGDSVTCKTWNHIWLNEGIGSYADALWEERKPGGGGLPTLHAIMDLRRTYIGPNSGAVYVSDGETGTWWDIFDPATTYYKGSWVTHMLRHLLGEEDFFDALKAYKATFEFQSVTTEDFQAVCESYYEGGDLEWFFHQWVYEEGSPIYRWGWDSMEINGSDYLLLSITQVQSSSYPVFIMPIDIVVDGTTYIVDNDADPQHFVMPVPSAPVSVEFDPDGWILWSSVAETGYDPGPPSVVETWPAPGTTQGPEQDVDTVTITFQTNVDLIESDLSLIGADTGSKSFTIPSGTNVNPALLQLDAPLPTDTYTLTVRDSVVSSDSGMALDGEIADPGDPGSLPSGDGVAGGDAVIEFSVVSDTIPAVSTWGQIAMALLTLTAGTVLLARRGRRRPEAA